MNIDIRKYIIDNFKDDGIEEIEKAINDSISSKDDDTLIGLGVLLELAWSNSDEDIKYNILNNIKRGINN
jgi:small acid-soluble spore protein I (minor)